MISHNLAIRCTYSGPHGHSLFACSGIYVPPSIQSYHTMLMDILAINLPTYIVRSHTILYKQCVCMLSSMQLSQLSILESVLMPKLFLP